jgi:S1-C subfamily serine protease
MAYRLIPDGKGAYLAVVSTKPQPGSAGESLELLTGDAVSAINDQPIRSEGDLNRLTFPQTIITIMKTFGGEPKRVVISTSRR